MLIGAVTRAHACANAQMSDFELDSDELSREFVIVIPLPGERLRPDSTLSKQHRYRALDVVLAASIEPFRTENDLTLADVALAVGAANPSVVSQWETGINVPSGVRRRRLQRDLDARVSVADLGHHVDRRTSGTRP
jgi:transcriptional regulator with XRE-family HTH domain